MNTIEKSVLGRMGVLPLWELGYRGSGVTVAVLDTGIIPNPKFANQVVYDEDFTGEGQPRDKTYSHGTTVASIVHSAAPEATLANLRVVPSRSEMVKDIAIQALKHCIDVYPKYRVVNISLSFERSGCPDDCPLCEMVDQAYRKGMLLIVAAGNEGPKPNTLTCPARAHWVLANVATVTKAEEDFWNNLGFLKRFWYKDVTGEFGKEYGTSFSAGWSSGSAAVLFSAFPKLDADTLRFALLKVAADINEKTGHETTLKYDQVYAYLLHLQAYAAIPGVLMTKDNSLRPLIEPF